MRPLATPAVSHVGFKVLQLLMQTTFQGSGEIKHVVMSTAAGLQLAKQFSPCAQLCQ